MDLSMSSPAYALLTFEDGQVKVDGVWRTDNKSSKFAKLKHGQKLKRIQDDIATVCNYDDITNVVREKGFNRFATATQVLFRVVGVSDLTIYNELGITSIDELSPTTVKKQITGDGKADKTVVEQFVRKYLSEEQKNMNFETDDCSDAVAVGIAWGIQKGLIKALE
jgi:crossover junction endodeoxyribonuclease RuvC